MHQVRDEAREAVLAMDLSTDDAFALCMNAVRQGWVDAVPHASGVSEFAANGGKLC